MKKPKSPAPAGVSAAASLIAFYGVLVVVNALIYSVSSGDWSDIHRAAFRLVGAGAVAWGLWQQEKWAWWTAVVLSFVFLLATLIGGGTLFYLQSRGALGRLPTGGLSLLILALMGLSLLAAIAALMPRSSRAAFGIGNAGKSLGAQGRHFGPPGSNPPGNSPGPWSS